MAVGRTRGDIVISMTLAETFLLLVFMLWFAVQPIKSERTDLRLALLAAENEKLLNENKKLHADLEDVNRQLSLWQKHFDMPLPGTEQDWEKFEQKLKVEIGRGKPRCADENLIARVNAINGKTRLTMIAALPALFQSSGLNLRPGTALTTDREIDLFLNTVQAYRKPPSQSECRFDYELLWATDHDYVEAREQRFDKYMYPVKRQQVRP